MHSLDGELTFQPYGKDRSHHINSISRAKLNIDLLHLAEADFNVPIYFNQKLIDADFKNKRFTFEDQNSNRTKTVTSNITFGTDGAFSVLRKKLCELSGFENNEIDSGAAYKELTILPNANGQHRMEKNALHIWPRKQFMLIALPNWDGSFTVTLFLPKMGENSFETLQSPQDVTRFFERHFPDVVPLLDNLTQTFFENPTGNLITIKCYPWTSRKKDMLILGDAAHGVIPFFGQGMNCGFEDVEVLDNLIEKYPRDHWQEIFSDFEHMRKPRTDAIADMSIENFVEMRDHVGNPKFLLKKGVEKILENQFPDAYTSRYSMVSFTRTPYDQAYQIGEIQKEILLELCQDIQKPEEVNLQKAKDLIFHKLIPFQKKIREGKKDELKP